MDNLKFAVVSQEVKNNDGRIFGAEKVSRKQLFNLVENVNGEVVHIAGPFAISREGFDAAADRIQAEVRNA